MKEGRMMNMGIRHSKIFLLVVETTPIHWKYQGPSTLLRLTIGSWISWFGEKPT